MRHLPLAFLLCFLTACGGRTATRHHVSGKITFNGAAVPGGRIYFTPDAAKKNVGVQGFAVIKNGEFDTRRDGKGGPGGAVEIRIEGFDASNKLIFIHEATDDLPTGDATKSYDVPASAAKNVVESKGPPP